MKTSKHIYLIGFKKLLKKINSYNLAVFQPLLILGLALQNPVFVYRRVHFCPYLQSRGNSDFCSECVEHSPSCNIMPVCLTVDSKDNAVQMFDFKLGVCPKIKSNCSNFLTLKVKWHSEFKISEIQQKDYRNKGKHFCDEGLHIKIIFPLFRWTGISQTLQPLVF